MKIYSPNNSTFSRALRTLSLFVCSAIVLTTVTSEPADGMQEKIIVPQIDKEKLLRKIQEAAKAQGKTTGPITITLDSENGKSETVLSVQDSEETVQDSEDTPQENNQEATPDAEEELPVVPLPQEPEIAPKFVRFHMWDGSIVGGEVQIDAIVIRTEFGRLEVPVEEILNLYPGLNSFPEMTSKIEKLVEGLGDKNFDVREKSQRELGSMGLQIRKELNRFNDGGSAERKKRITEIKNAIDEELSSMEEEELALDPLSQPLIRGDKIETELFSIVGKIEQEEFVLASKFGELTVKLSDVRMANRPVIKKPGVVTKKCEVDGHAFFQKNTHSTRIRLQKGDRVSITADGTVRWKNWSTSSTPDGLDNQGDYQDIQCGTLCARIGQTGDLIKIGTKHSLVAEKSGVLFLGIAMKDSYASNSGYRWIGTYTARVEVKPPEEAKPAETK